MAIRVRKERLDVLLVRRGLFESRERAQRAVMAGDVTVAGQVALKCGTSFAEDVVVEVRSPAKYVGRGGFKLEGALDGFGVNPEGWTCLDIGASTGGFTDCLLQRGAVRVYAVDVGHSQLDWRIRSHPRVVVKEHLNARHLSAEDVPELVDLVVIDVSFISLTLILGPAFERVRAGGLVIPLIKPQFELRREDVARGGVVRDPALHASAVERVRTFVAGISGVGWEGEMVSPITGGDGNVEFLALLRKG
jgi:23S rRNA (cytidine1920-2'-O)/16S rRNA (cytidine1409-2'-O)-methyltransferase